uniref:Fe2OG dioxygenase domain-containing protein n=2 Tax=Macrostomum lignano TaxID=282301 RepID=A0A1I8HNK4_9PLAT
LQAKAKTKASRRGNHTDNGTKKSSISAWLMPGAAVAIVAICFGICYQNFAKDTIRNEQVVLAPANQSFIEPTQRQFECAKAYTAELRHLRPDCLPASCGRFVHYGIATEAEAAALLALAKRGFALGGGSGGATILDLHSGALSLGQKFVNVYTVDGRNGGRGFVPTESERRLYAGVVNRIRLAVAAAFKVSNAESLRLTKPTFFSRLTSAEARTQHDEYWHSHVDKDTYGSFHYTSLLYLANYGTDFTGGRFLFLDSNGTSTAFVEPRTGRVSAFTSGSENTHRVERVTSGQRFALTIAFTCDPAAAIDPSAMGG